MVLVVVNGKSDVKVRGKDEGGQSSVRNEGRGLGVHRNSNLLNIISPEKTTVNITIPHDAYSGVFICVYCHKRGQVETRPRPHSCIVSGYFCSFASSGLVRLVRISLGPSSKTGPWAIGLLCVAGWAGSHRRLVGVIVSSYKIYFSLKETYGFGGRTQAPIPGVLLIASIFPSPWRSSLTSLQQCI